MVKARIETHSVVCMYNGCKGCPLLEMFSHDNQPHGTHEYEITEAQERILRKHLNGRTVSVFRDFNAQILRELLDADTSDSADKIAEVLTSEYSFNIFIKTLLRIAEDVGEEDFACNIGLLSLEERNF